eukprot:6594606-Prorocentrum_lima.AAC.1
MYLEKPTDILAFDERLIQDMRTLQCNGRHQRIPIEGGRAHPARIWTCLLYTSPSPRDSTSS